MRMNRFGGAIILAEDGTVEYDLPTVAARRGRPAKTTEVKVAVTNWLISMHKKGGTPDKKEALVQETIDFAKDILGADISRGIAQKYITDAQVRLGVDVRLPSAA